MTYFDDDADVGVLTIGDEASKPLGIGTVIIRIKDDVGVDCAVELKETLYFPQSPVKILGVTVLAEQLKDEEGTWIKTCQKKSIFAWDKEKHIVSFSHPHSNLPMISVNQGFGSFTSFSAFCSRCIPINQPAALTTCRTCLPQDGCEDISMLDDTIDYDDELTSHFDSPSVYMVYKKGDRLRLIKDGMNEIVTVNAVTKDRDTGMAQYSVSLPDDRMMTVLGLFLSDLEDDDIMSIPFSETELREQIKHLPSETLDAILHPPSPSPLLTEFMAWHNRMGHLPFKDMFQLCRNGQAPRKFLKLENTKLICPSCTFANCKKKKWRTKKQHGSLRSESDLCPGDATSMDHVISAQPGLVPRLDGRHTRDRIVGACVFFDHVSNHSYTHLQTSIDNAQTLEAKKGYQRFASSHGVTLKRFHADNGIFAEKVFRDDLDANDQAITFCAVGVHHQNGLVERHIQTLSRGARASLLHAKRHWDEAVGTILWPYAWKDFEEKYNNFHLNEKGESPLNLFSESEVKADLKNYHPFGCPVFVLDARMQSGTIGVPKWEPRSRVGVYLGHSPCHAGSVALVLNPRTLRVSPQFHLVYDDEFSTVQFMRNGEIPPHWSELVRHSSTVSTTERFDQATNCANDYINGAVGKLASVAEEDSNVLNASRGDYSPEVSNSEEGSLNSEEEVPSDAVSEGVGAENALLFPTVPDLNDLTRRQSGRTRRMTARARDSSLGTAQRMFSLFTAGFVLVASLTTSMTEKPVSLVQKVAYYTEQANTLFDGTLNKVHNMAFTAVGDSNDVYTFREVLKQEDLPDFISAMVKEVEDHESRDHWTLIPRSELPPGEKTILAIWSFKRKRFPDGRIMKHKAPLCAHGGMQTWGVNYWETYSPVVNWLSVRILMALSVIHDLETKSIDFVLAFPQAEIDVPVYMELPVGFEAEGSERHVLRLNKNLYGLKQASHNFFNMLKAGLEARGYEKQSATDSCVFLGKESVVLLYVDDCIIFQRKGSDAADTLIRLLQEEKQKFTFTNDGDLERYLGVDGDRRENGYIALTQKHLIQRTLSLLNIDDKVNSRSTPAIKPVLFKDDDGPPRKTSWNYRQLIGMLTYLQATTRPDIAMAVHQAARFSINPRLSHQRAVIRIGKYLKGSEDKGLIFKPDPSKGLECFVDADFAGGWNKSDSSDASSVMSRTGYVLMYCGCPITWCSKLQTEIALSTTEAEYIALSQAMREVIPVMELLKELNEIFETFIPTPKIHCKTWEDNNGCLSLATNHKFTPRTKHIAIKYHHFRHHVKNGSISIHPINTTEQTADIFTKPLDEKLFIYLRKKLSGW